LSQQGQAPGAETIDSGDSREYRAPALYLWIFYLLLVAWAAVCIILIGSKAAASGWALGQLLMIAFVLAYTWYFSLGIVYRLRVQGNGPAELVSFRRTIRLEASQIQAIEAPKLPLGFIRLKLEREKVYIFCRVQDQALQGLLAVLRKANPEIKLKS